MSGPQVPWRLRQHAHVVVGVPGQHRVVAVGECGGGVLLVVGIRDMLEGAIVDDAR